MKKILFLCLFLIVIVLCPVITWGQSILPFTHNFDTENYPVWGDSVYTHITGSACYGGNGGCVRFIPPLAPPASRYSGMGQWPNFPANTRRINIRVLVKVGSTYASTVRNIDAGIQNKMFIVLKNDDTRRLLGIFEGGTSGGATFFTWGACPGTNACRYWQDPYNPDNYWPVADDPFRSPPYVNEWVCVEYEHDLDAGTSKTYIWTQDGVNNGLHVSTTLDNTIGSWAYLQIIGGYFNGYHVSDPNNWLMFDSLVISNTYIGPPQDFLTGPDTTPPSPPTGVAVN